MTKKKKQLPYHSDIERVHTRAKLDWILAAYVKAQSKLTMSSTKKQKQAASLNTISAKHGISRSTLGYYKKRKIG